MVICSVSGDVSMGRLYGDNMMLESREVSYTLAQSKRFLTRAINS
jgi:hypothetical protein